METGGKHRNASATTDRSRPMPPDAMAASDAKTPCQAKRPSAAPTPERTAATGRRDGTALPVATCTPRITTAATMQACPNTDDRRTRRVPARRETSDTRTRQASATSDSPSAKMFGME